jgi:hypothetical protein
MVDTKPLLKGFGATADVATQIATDKAINSRRQSAESSRLSFLATSAAAEPAPYDISQGELIEDYDLGGSNPAVVPHSLGYLPRGALVLKSDTPGSDSIDCVGATEDDVTIRNPGLNRIVTLWVT